MLKQTDNEEEKINGDLLKGDFCTYFGSYNANEDLQNEETLEPSKLNDVILPKIEGFGLRHFLIEFVLE